MTRLLYTAFVGWMFIGSVWGQAPSVADISLLPKASRSLSRRFVVHGSNAGQKLDIMVWVERITERIERDVGVRIPSRPWRTIRIVIRDPHEEATGNVGIRQAIAEHQLVQTLVLDGYEKANLSMAREGLTFLLLNALVTESFVQRAKQLPPADALPSVPRWLWKGVSGNLFVETRAANSRTVLAAWESGRLDTVTTFLKRMNHSAGKDERDATLRARDDAVAVLLTGWLESLPDRSKRFALLFDHLSKGQAVTVEWLVGNMETWGDVSALEIGWDMWMVRQRRKVFVPGKTEDIVVALFRQELLIFPGQYGIPLSTNLHEQLTFRGLIGKRKAEWVPTLVSGKSASLQLLAVGRGKGFLQVVESYCAFLAALGEQRGEAELWRRLVEAERVLQDFLGTRKKAAVSTTGDKDGKTDDHRGDD